MNIQPIVFGEFTLGSAQPAATEAAPGFSSILADTLYQSNTTDATNETGNQALVLGLDNSLHQTMIESSKAEMAINLTVQIRNRVVEAYNEINRMQV